MFQALIRFHGVSEGVVALTAFINDVSYLSEGIITEVKSYSKKHKGKRKEFWGSVPLVYLGSGFAESHTVQVLGYASDMSADLKSHFYCAWLLFKKV